MDDSNVTIVNFEALVSQAQLGVIDGLNQAAVEFMVALASELPEGYAAKSIKITAPVSTDGGRYTISVGIQDQGVLKYLMTYWTGKTNSVVIPKDGPRPMSFSRWANGPSDLRGKDGMFHFKRVTHTYLAHDFVERAIAKFTALVPTVSQKLAQRFKK